MRGPGPTDSITFVVVTGMSGAGKSFAIKCLEDMGFYCIDNPPTTLIPTVADRVVEYEPMPQRVALGVDVRAGAYLSHLIDAIDALRARGHRVEVLFLEASDETLVRRYHETRRRHPLAGDGQVLDGILEERKALASLRMIADRIVDTSARTVHQFKDQLLTMYGPARARTGLATTLISFGFKHGIPYDADLVFDIRFLPNPHFVKDLRALDGRDPRVSEFIFEHEESRELLRRLEDLLDFLLPAYQREGKTYLTVAVGCTGGRHRSVSFVEALRRFLDERGLPPSVVHRDMERE